MTSGLVNESSGRVHVPGQSNWKAGGDVNERSLASGRLQPVRIVRVQASR